MHAVVAGLAALTALFAYLSYRMARTWLREAVPGYIDYLEAFAAVVFAVLTVMSIIALGVKVAAAAP